MKWFPMLRRSPVVSADERSWTTDEVAALAEAVRRAPSAYDTQPWSLRMHGRTATLRLRPMAELVRQDPEGRDRRMSCGSAVANLVVAMRGLGWATDVSWDDESDGEATMIGTHRQHPTAVDRDRWQAIARRVDFRRAFTDRPIPHLARAAVLDASTTQATWVDGAVEEHALARLLGYAARADHDDSNYQQELGVWIAPIAGDGLSTDVPDLERIAQWLTPESVLVFSTITDNPRDHLQVGEAAERAWLEATRLGLAASVLAQPLRLPEVRFGFRDELGLDGVPQLLMRVGYPAAIPMPRTIRRQSNALAD
ncbi:nitroreductase family protein [Saccharopolyspora sp. K220]|uniref:nitroreductase family protein n=1 Tax=Saccharopolyspora soli TaxID=2926618 RepID=UPI001F57C703|nr:nitroreductase family protein [Saccharopolyspora soli]MCI2420754.1 nitroreductase family protein [Saccharopolyspora soli]